MGINFPEPSYSGVFITALILSVIFDHFSSRCSFFPYEAFLFLSQCQHDPKTKKVSSAVFPPDTVPSNVLHLSEFSSYFNCKGDESGT